MLIGKGRDIWGRDQLRRTIPDQLGTSLMHARQGFRYQFTSFMGFKAVTREEIFKPLSEVTFSCIDGEDRIQAVA